MTNDPATPTPGDRSARWRRDHRRQPHRHGGLRGHRDHRRGRLLDRRQWVGAITAMSLFAVGVFAFLWSYWNAVQRSRERRIGVTQLYLLVGPPTPTGPTAHARIAGRPGGGRHGHGARPAKDPTASPGSSLAVGFLVPMLGFGLNGLWAAYHGSSRHSRHGGTSEMEGIRMADRIGRRTRIGATSAAPIGQNEDHG